MPEALRTIVAGMRDFTDSAVVADAVLSAPWEVGTVLSGGASGVDAAGERVARAFGLPVERYPADWNRHGRAAGPIRNRQMAENADALVAVWNGKSRGTRNMIETARSLGLRVHVHRVDSPEA